MGEPSGDELGIRRRGSRLLPREGQEKAASGVVSYHEEGRCGSLKKAMCGTRDAAQNWKLEYTETMTVAGFRQGVCTARVFYHEDKKVRVVVRRDDFTALGPNSSFDWFCGLVQESIWVKLKGKLERVKPGAVMILSRIATVIVGVRG